MANEPALNMEFFNENINGSKNINTEYKQTIEKEDHIITGECYLNYLFSNDYMKPFIRKNYLFKDDKKKSYFDKLNILNYKDIFNDILNKKKKNFITSDNELIKRILTVIDTNYESGNNRFKKKNKYYLKNINTKYSSYLNNINENNSITNYNTKLLTSFDQYKLPKINMKKARIINKIEKEKERDSFEYSNPNDIFRVTSCANPNKVSKSNYNKNYDIRNEEHNKRLHLYSPLLKKNLHHIFGGVERNESLSVKKSKYIQDGIGKINKTKFNIDSYDFIKNRYKIKRKNNNDKKYGLINLFTDIGKIKSPQEIEKTLFNKDENITFCKLKKNLEKSGIKRINKNMELSLQSNCFH